MSSAHSALPGKMYCSCQIKPVILMQNMGEWAYTVHIQFTFVLSKYKFELIQISAWSVQRA